MWAGCEMRQEPRVLTLFGLTERVFSVLLILAILRYKGGNPKSDEQQEASRKQIDISRPSI